MNSLLLEVLTPEKVVLKEEVELVELQGECGRLGILPEHTALIAKLSFGLLEYKSSQGTGKLACGHGVVEVLDNHVLVLVDTAEKPSEIDHNRAEAAKRRAEERLKEKDSGVDVERAALALHRAIQRIHFSSDRS